MNSAAPFRVGVLLLHYRNWPGVNATLDGVRALGAAGAEVIVLDNASRDGSAAALKAAHPELQVVALPENLGYAGAMNHGCRMLLARGVDAVLLLTHDVLLDGHTVELLAARLQQAPRVGAVGPLLRLRSRPEEIFSAGVRLSRRKYDQQHLGEQERAAAWSERPPQHVDGLDGACILLRSEAVRDVGPLDEQYFLYFEELDYLVRMARRGWDVECVPAAQAWQEPGNFTPYLRVRNRLRFVHRTAPRRYLALEITRQLRFVVRDRLRPASTEAARSVRPRVDGLVDFTRGRFGPPH